MNVMEICEWEYVYECIVSYICSAYIGMSIYRYVNMHEKVSLL